MMAEVGVEETGVPCTICARLTFSIINSPYAQNQPFLSSCMLTDLYSCRDLTDQPAWARTLQPILNTATRGSLLPHESWAQSLQSRGPQGQTPSPRCYLSGSPPATLPFPSLSFTSLGPLGVRVGCRWGGEWREV